MEIFRFVRLKINLCEKMDVLLRQMIPSTTLLLILSLFEAFVMHMLICKKNPIRDLVIHHQELCFLLQESSWGNQLFLFPLR